MAYNENLANRVREHLEDQGYVEEKKMFKGLCFMVNNKLCICVRDQEILCRLGEEQVLREIEKDGCRPMIHNGRPMKDYLFVEDLRLQKQAELQYWIKLCLEFNVQAKSSKK